MHLVGLVGKSFYPHVTEGCTGVRKTWCNLNNVIQEQTASLAREQAFLPALT